MRNALAVLRTTMETAEVCVGDQGTGFCMSVDSLDAIQRRLEAALERLERRTP